MIKTYLKAVIMIPLNFKMCFSGVPLCKNIIFHLFMMCDLDGKIPLGKN